MKKIVFVFAVVAALVAGCSKSTPTNKCYACITKDGNSNIDTAIYCGSNGVVAYPPTQYLSTTFIQAGQSPTDSIKCALK